VPIVENKEEELGEMKEIYTKENVIFLVAILFLFIHPINPIEFMTKKSGGVINGKVLIMVLILIFPKVFFTSLMHY
jgi:hypothetical protein